MSAITRKYDSGVSFMATRWLIAAAMAFALFILCMIPGQAFAVGEGDATQGSAPSVSNVMTLNATSCSSGNEKYATTGKYLLLNNNGTGMFVHKSAAYSITWTINGNSFKATDHTGKQLTGTMVSDTVMQAEYENYKYTYEIAQENAPITKLSPSTWWNGLPLVFDEANLLTQEQRDTLQKRAEEMSSKYKCNVYLIVVNDMTQYSKRGSIEAFAEEVCVGYQLGYGKDLDCVALVMSMNNRKYDLTSYGPIGLNKVFTEQNREWVVNQFLPSFKENKWYEGFSKYLDAADQALSHSEQGIPVTRPNNVLHILVSVLICLIVGFGIASIIAKVMGRRLKTVYESDEAHGYSGDEGTKVTYRSDVYTGTTTSRVYSPQQKSDSGGGGGSFTSSSGRGHSSGSF